MEDYKTVFKENSAEYTVSRSRFIAVIYHAESETEAINAIKSQKSRFFDAKHSVFAYSLRNNNLMRFSDDGEPQGTAGKPVLDVLNGNGITDAVIVVTRYFGGILLGTGGLVRAYSKAAADCVASADIINMSMCYEYELRCDYSSFSTLKYVIESNDGSVLSSNFDTAVTVIFSVKCENTDKIIKMLSDKFSGAVTVKERGFSYLPVSISKKTQ